MILKFIWNHELTSIHLYDFQFAAKDLDRKSKKCEKEEKAEKLKLKKVEWTSSLMLLCLSCTFLVGACVLCRKLLQPSDGQLYMPPVTH